MYHEPIIKKVLFDRALDIINSSNPNIKEKYFMVDASGANFEKPTVNTLFFKIGENPYYIYKVEYYYNDVTIIDLLKKNGFTKTVW